MSPTEKTLHKETQDKCEEIDLVDYDIEGKPIPKEKIDAPELLQKMSEICIDAQIINTMTEFCYQENSKLVLSLAGGAARGIAGNLALVYLLDKLDLLNKFEAIWGTSAGAIVGAGVALKISFPEIATSIIALKNRDLLEFTLSGTIKNKGIFRISKAAEYLDKIYNHKSFNDCLIPFFALTTRFDGKSEEIEILQKGKIIDAVVASMCVPEIFDPVIINGITYVDGGLIENIPSISILKHHQNQMDPRKLVILGVNFNEEHFDPKIKSPTKKILNLLSVYQRQLALDKIERVRDCTPEAMMSVIEYDIPIANTEFNKIGRSLLTVYKNLLEKLLIWADKKSFNSSV